MKILTSNAKLDKANSNYINLGIALLPEKTSGYGNVCPFAGDCVKTCIAFSGMNRFPTAIESKRMRTKLFFENFELFKVMLVAELITYREKAKKEKKKLAIRLNMYSDIFWEVKFPELFTMFPEVQFYDYTKAPLKARPVKSIPKNYNLTYSFNEKTTTKDYDLKIRNMSIVFKDKKLPKKYFGIKVIDGDKHDLRFLDKKNVIVGLTAKNGLLNNKESRFAV